MSKTKHSAGPWQLGHIGPCVIVTDEYRMVADPYGETKEQEIANAQLISAAPDMLRVCEATLEKLLTCFSPNDESEHEIVMALDSVIKKARGE